MASPKRVVLFVSRAIPPRWCIFTAALPFVSLLFVLWVSPLRAQSSSSAGERSVVLVDAAHGGDDTGAGLGTQSEKAITLALSVKLRSLLAARGFSVVTTRESDTTVPADKRAEIADHATPLACVSLHATHAGAGVHLFISSLPATPSSRFLAWKTSQSAWITRSLALAGVINSALGQAGVTVTLGRTDLPTIDSLDCPAVAVEVAPQPSADSAQVVGPDDQALQAHVAEALAAALVEWRAQAKGGRLP